MNLRLIKFKKNSPIWYICEYKEKKSTGHLSEFLKDNYEVMYLEMYYQDYQY